jgi:hypothetical protein
MRMAFGHLVGSKGICGIGSFETVLTHRLPQRSKASAGLEDGPRLLPVHSSRPWSNFPVPSYWTRAAPTDRAISSGLR